MVRAPRARYLGWTLPPPLDTGFPSADAQDDFQRARRRQVMSRLARRVGREPGDVDVILPYDEVVAALGYLEEPTSGCRPSPLDSILGTVDRAKGFDRQFRPTTARVRARWERIANAMRRGEPMPPISLYRIGEVYFVRDGHHRVSVARALGRTRHRGLRRRGPHAGRRRPHAARRRPAQEEPRAHLPRARAAARPRARALARDRRLGLRRWPRASRRGPSALMQDRAELLDRATAARRWFDEEYSPVVEMLREADMIGTGTEADAYLRVARQRYRLMRTHEWSEDVLARVREDGRPSPAIELAGGSPGPARRPMPPAIHGRGGIVDAGANGDPSAIVDAGDDPRHVRRW